MEIEKYQEEFHKELKKKRIVQTIVSIVILSGFGFAHYSFEFNLQLITPYITPLNVAAFALVAMIWRFKFAGGIKCPRCQTSIGYVNYNKHRFQKRCCGNCGLLYNPSAKLMSLKESKFMEQKIRPGFLAAIAGFGLGLALFGYYIDNQSLVIAGLASVGFICL